MSCEREENSSMPEGSSEGTIMLNSTGANCLQEVPNLIVDFNFVKSEIQPECGFSMDLVMTIKMKRPQSVPGEPGTDDPITDDPITDDPITDDPITDDPITDNPITDDPTTDDPIMDDPITDDPIMDESNHGRV